MAVLVSKELYSVQDSNLSLFDLLNGSWIYTFSVTSY